MAQVRITRRPAKRRMVDKAELLAVQLRQVGISGWVREHRFHPKRLWRLDVAFPVERLAIEVEGFAAGGQAGRHQRVVGFTADCEKYAELAIMGWRLIRVTTRQVTQGVALRWVERALAAAPVAPETVQ